MKNNTTTLPLVPRYLVSISSDLICSVANCWISSPPMDSANHKCNPFVFNVVVLFIPSTATHTREPSTASHDAPPPQRASLIAKCTQKRNGDVPGRLKPWAMYYRLDIRTKLSSPFFTGDDAVTSLAPIPNSHKHEHAHCVSLSYSLISYADST